MSSSIEAQLQQGDTPGVPSSGVKGGFAFGPYKKSPHKATLPRPRNVAALPNIQKQTQGSYQNEEINKYCMSQMKE